MFDGHSMHQAAQERQQQDGKSAASQGSARESSHGESNAASSMQEDGTASAGDEATSSVDNRVCIAFLCFYASLCIIDWGIDSQSS